jgi:hypothetical protein
VPCTAGTAGTIDVSYDAAGHAILTCVASDGGGGGGAAIRINEFSTGSRRRANELRGGCPMGNLASELSDVHEGFRQRLAEIFDQWRETLAGTLAAGSFYRFGGSGYSGPPAADQSFSAGMASTAGGVGIRDTDGTLVDSVGYGSSAANGFVEGTPAPPTTPLRSSDVRRPDGHDTNDNSVDVTVASPPSPRATNGS